MTLRELGSLLQGHPDMTRTPGVEISTGSLGMGFSAAIGMALAGKRDGRPYRVYAALGDGEPRKDRSGRASCSPRTTGWTT